MTVCMSCAWTAGNDRERPGSAVAVEQAPEIAPGPVTWADTTFRLIGEVVAGVGFEPT